MNGMLYVYKTMPGKLQNEWRSSAIFILLIIMMASLFVSRAVLSVSMMAFVAISFFHSDVKNQLRKFFRSPLLVGVSFLFLLPLLSGLWSTDRQQWMDILRIKLPLLMLPLSFAGPFSFSKKKWEILAIIFIALVTAGSVWCLFHYAADPQAVQEGYLRAKSVTTPLKNDHVRFSWMVSVAILLSGWLGWEKKNQSRTMTGIFFVVAIWLGIFLHILAARTGLFSFYIMVLIIAGWLMIRKLKTKYAAVLLFAIVVLPVTAWFTLPTFHNRVKYFLYEFEYLKKTHYLPGANDAVRVISLKAGWELLKAHPFTGTGFGDVKGETRKWYAAAYPAMNERDKIDPSSEWLIYGVGCGWPGLLIFTMIMLVPFLCHGKNNLLWWGINVSAAFSFLFDIGLEVQFGVFLYAFCVLWWWKWLVPEKV